MTTKGVADIVFCLDASDSMRPCFNGMQRHIGDFVAGLDSNTQIEWDWRIDFLAHSASASAFRGESLFLDTGQLIDALYHNQGTGQFFTSDIQSLRQRLERIKLLGDESPLIALDFCLDYPWREATHCHRIIVMMTDEPFETSAAQQDQLAVLPTLIDKIQRQRVMLYIVAPDSPAFDQLSTVEKSVYDVVDGVGDGLGAVDFHQVLTEIGKSVSVCDWQTPKPEIVQRGVFQQAAWTQGATIAPRDHK